MNLLERDQPEREGSHRWTRGAWPVQCDDEQEDGMRRWWCGPKQPTRTHAIDRSIEPAAAVYRTADPSSAVGVKLRVGESPERERASSPPPQGEPRAKPKPTEPRGRVTANLVDPASSHMLRSRAKPCMSQSKRFRQWVCEWLLTSAVISVIACGRHRLSSRCPVGHPPKPCG
jgi:hypothetical protein